MDGLAATQAIRALPGEERKIPIIAMTANVVGDIVAQCQLAGFRDYIAKPFRPAALVGALERCTVAQVKQERNKQTVTPPKLTPILDQEHLTELLDAMGADSVRDLMSDFRLNAPAWLSSVVEAIDRDQLTRLGQRAHTLISSASPLGLMDSAFAAREVKRLCFEGNGDEARRLARTLPQKLDLAMIRLDQWLAESEGMSAAS